MIVREKQVKDYLTASKIGSFAINPYIGCPHACTYCYASFMKRFTNHPEPWGEFIDIKHCEKPIDLKKICGKNVFMSTVTDCYNPYEKKYGITRSILEQLVNAECILQVSTKSALVLRDMDLYRKMENVSVAMSVNTLDDGFRGDMDCAGSVAERLATLKTLHAHGIYTILFMSPIFLHITDWQAIIEESREYIGEYWFEDLNLRGSYKRAVMDYVREKYPEAFPSYDRLYNHGDRTEITRMENAIRSYCETNGVRYCDYFHHEKVISDPSNKVLGKNY
jgi:DNA repair photolyase